MVTVVLSNFEMWNLIYHNMSGSASLCDFLPKPGVPVSCCFFLINYSLLLLLLTFFTEPWKRERNWKLWKQKLCKTFGSITVNVFPGQFSTKRKQREQTNQTSGIGLFCRLLFSDWILSSQSVLSNSIVIYCICYVHLPDFVKVHFFSRIHVPSRALHFICLDISLLLSC